MAMYRLAYVVKVMFGISLVIAVAYAMYLFEIHVIYPPWRKESTLVQLQDDGPKQHENLNIRTNSNSNVTTIRPTVRSAKQNQTNTVSLPFDSEQHKPNADALFQRLVIVTAFTEEQKVDALQMISSVQTFMPDTRIIIYNIGIREESLQDIKKLCNVQVRHFSFETHPRHVRNLRIFAWRPIIIQESVNEFGVVFWADPNVRFSSTLRALFPHIHIHHGAMFHIHGFDPKIPSTTTLHVYFKTVPSLFSYFKVERTQYFASNNSSPHLATGRMLIVNNSVIQERLLQPLTRCALNGKCISPRGSTMTNHKFDTSALAIIVYKHLLHEWTPENDTTMFFDDVVKIRYTNLVTKHPDYCF